VAAVAVPSISRKILIVDDDEAGAEAHARMLRLEGYTVDTAATAEIGLHQAQLGRPDAIILDLHMPLIDGIGFLQRLRSQEGLGTTPVAIVTGDYFLDEAVASEIKALGAQVTYKPLWLDELVQLARTLVEVIH